MIGLLEGSPLDILEKTVILSVGGVGYELSVTAEARTACQRALSENANVVLRVHTHVREDQISLFGFASLRERELFRLLISVSGIGPKSALDVLSAPSSDVINALRDENVAFLLSCPGIGKKTAERLIIELKDKVLTWETVGTMETSVGYRRPVGLEENYGDVIEALVRLGYDKRHILPVLSRFVEEQGSTIPTEEESIRYCLAHL
ncbi:Holliday junction branch migration protein RuvA [Candidatus Gracilibacteria bacterium CG17_big_fil_post_rev_8_21_14_2_50_48_13]|nr:MAG: Holliday junction branch migration protein RuvA [Candidatus Gracilibacteria bacterium CG17_big_fil_post_rev_8_21_14_2_50_48_13]